MRRSSRLLEKCFVKYDGGYPALVKFTDAVHSDLLLNLRSTFLPRFLDLPIEHFQLFKANDDKAIQHIKDVNIADYQTENNPLI
jgi:hypothetical protein